MCTVDCGSTSEGSIPSVRPKIPSKPKQTRHLSVEQEEASASLADGAFFILDKGKNVTSDQKVTLTI